MNEQMNERVFLSIASNVQWQFIFLIKINYLKYYFHILTRKYSFEYMSGKSSITVQCCE